MNYYSTGFDFKICLLAQIVTGLFRKWGPGKDNLARASLEKKSYIKYPSNWNDKTLEIDCYNKQLDRGVEILFECNICLCFDVDKQGFCYVPLLTCHCVHVKWIPPNMATVYK